jgi:hypothetical protein
MVVDSLREHRDVTEVIPAVKVLQLHRSAAAAVALTHPHLDHSDGLPSVLDHRIAESPVGCLAAHFDPPERWRGNADGQVELKAAATEAALQRIFDIWEREPMSRWELVTHAERTLGEGTVTVVHPPADRAPRLAAGRDPNRASSPLMVDWAGPSVLLGADLPNTEWRRVAASFPRSGELVSTPVLKVSHHCSVKAQHQLVIGRAPRRDRACIATPWTWGARSKRLPRFETDHGVDKLLETAHELLLSSMPHPYDVRRGQRLTRKAADRTRQQRRVGSELLLDIEPLAPSVDDCWVHVAIDQNGRVAAQVGPAAVAIVP